MNTHTLAPIPSQINVPRMVNPAHIRASSGAIIQQRPPVQIQSHPPALHPVSQNTFAPGGAQVSSSIATKYNLTYICPNLITVPVE